MKPLRFHTLRQFSISKLHRLQDTQIKLHTYIEHQTPKRLRRIVGPPPARETLRTSLRRSVDVLLRPDEECHQRKKRRVSEYIQDWLDLSDFVNGESYVPDDPKAIVHHCWDPKRCKPCCETRAVAVDKAVVLMGNAFYGRLDATPAESTWTHTINNCKQGILRRHCGGMGLDSFTYDSSVPLPPQAEVDGEAISPSYHVDQNKTRGARTSSYYKSQELHDELAIITLPLDEFDHKLL